MADAITSPPEAADVDLIRAAWLRRLTDLIDRVDAWCQAQGWATRRIEKKLDDLEIGVHRVPALLMQEGVTRLILEPIGRTAVGGAAGIVDMYRLPAYDDVATLFFESEQWVIRYPLPGDRIAQRDETVELNPLTNETLGRVLMDMIRDDS